MSAPNVSDDVEQYVKQLEPETQDVVQQAYDLVQSVANAADEVLDVVNDLMPIFDALARGKRAKAIDAAINLFSDETSQEAREAQAALEATQREANRLWAEMEELREEFMSVIDDVREEIEDSDIVDTVTDWFNF